MKYYNLKYKILIIILILVFGLIYFSMFYSNADIIAVDKGAIDNGIIAVDFPTLDYVSDNRVIFHYGIGVFFYDTNKNKIYRTVDLEPYGYNYSNGDNTPEIMVSPDGEVLYICGNHCKNEKSKYKYNIKRNTMNKVSEVNLLHDDNIYPMADIYKKFKEIEYLGHQGKFSHEVYKIDNEKYAYLYCEDGRFSNLEIIYYDTKDNKSWSNYLFK